MPEQPTLWDSLGVAPAPGSQACVAPILPEHFAEPPEFEVRVNPRARRVLVRVRAGLPVLVTLPRGVARRHAAEAVREHAGWIEKTRARIESEAGLLAARRAQPVGSTVELAGIDARYIVERRAGAGSTVRATASADRVVLSGAVADDAAVTEAMRRWVRRVADSELTALAEELARATGSEPRDITVCWPRSRWGSCSSAGHVRLSTDLVFLPAELTCSVILHEFAHLRVLDHSTRFYTQLQTLDPAWREHRAALRAGRDHIPGWALRD
jgi:hypothetical protein